MKAPQWLHSALVGGAAAAMTYIADAVQRLVSSGTLTLGGARAGLTALIIGAVMTGLARFLGIAVRWMTTPEAPPGQLGTLTGSSARLAFLTMFGFAAAASAQVPAAPASVTYSVIRPAVWPIDSGDAVEVRWAAVAGASGYNTRLVDSAYAIPPPPADVDTIRPSVDPTGGWHQFGAAKTVDTFFVRIRSGQRFPTRAVVRAVNASGPGPFGVTSSQGLSRCPCGVTPPPPPPPAPLPPPPPPPPTVYVDLAPQTVSTEVGQPVTFVARVFENGVVVVGRRVTWGTSDATIATVDSFGTTMSLKPGVVSVTATSGATFARTTLTVTPKRVGRTERTYADITLKNGKLYVSRVDSTGGVSYLRVFERSSTTDSLGQYRGGGFNVRPFMAPVYAAHVRRTADDMATQTDTSDVTLNNILTSIRARCARTGCWATITNKGRSGSWTQSPKLPAAILRGIAHALEAAGRGDSVFTAADSLPYVRTPL